MGLKSSRKEKCPNPLGPWGGQLKLPCSFVTLNGGTVSPPESPGLETDLSFWPLTTSQCW